ncbi:DUF418 domain-containing protein [Nonomuraea pusilla]|uniref:Uncharacterized membrane protein YeiB n=1 Tax=Nonomuraea pusilla TaxID=46177 RepID=A0A1H8CJQ7_9ACTN|nr:DUF418 domain-containing protein [Nonomuraea pusilla]SEM94508.1 Uncharacterized membrane protein YeiB [Nonomuraea pusilla]
MTSTAPTAVTARSLAPDLARGVMLLLIALAHAPAFVDDRPTGSATLDAAGRFVKSLLVDNQARAMFVFLFGYGLGQLARALRARDADWTATRTLMRRRATWLVVIGFLNTVVLVPLDIVAVYGLALLLLAPLVRARDAVLWRIALPALVPATLLVAWQSVQAQVRPVVGAAFMEPTFGAHLLANLPSWPVETAVSVVVVVPGMLVGVWAERRRVLDEPERHVRVLRRLTLSLLGVAMIGRLPSALAAAGAWTPSSDAARWAAAVAHDLTGYAGGIGMATAVGLVALKAGRGPLTTALAALGQRSLTFYLFQSAVWLALFYPFTLGLHDEAGFLAGCGIAVATWALSVLLAEWMRRAGLRGPAEVALRRLTYRDRPPAPSRSSAAP